MPVFPVLSYMVAIWASLLEIMIIVMRWRTNGQHPSDLKLFACSIVLVTAALLRWRWGRKYGQTLKTMAQLRRQGLAQPAISERAKNGIILIVLALGCFGGWIFSGR